VRRGHVAVDQEIGDLHEARVRGEILDRISAVAQNPFFAVQIGNGTFAGSGVDIPVVQSDGAGFFAQGGDVDPEFMLTAGDHRELVGLAAEVERCDVVGCGHIGFRGRGWFEKNGMRQLRWSGLSIRTGKPLGEKPAQDLAVGVGAGPDIVAGAGVFAVLDVAAARLEGADHVA